MKYPIPELDDIDKFHPPMMWTARWSTGDNIPLGIHLPRAVQVVTGAADFYPAGLWLFSEEGHGRRIAAAKQEHAGIQVLAYRGDEAIARFMNRIDPEEPTP